MTDEVEVQPVEVGRGADQVIERRLECLDHARRRRIEPDAARAHAQPGAVRLGDLEVGVVEQAAPATVDDHRLSAHPREQRRVAVGREREGVEPGVHALAALVRQPDQQAQGILADRLQRRAVRRGIGHLGRIPAAPAAVDLNEQVRHLLGLGVPPDAPPRAPVRGRRRGAWVGARTGRMTPEGQDERDETAHSERES